MAIRQYVWGTQYVDELVQTSVNAAPESDNTCELPYWAIQDANYNVLGALGFDFGSETLHFSERYEYTPYGERTVFRLTGVQGPTDVSSPMLPTLDTERVGDNAYGLCDVGHQGLFFDKEWGWYQNRRRDYIPGFGRFARPQPPQLLVPA